jgi:hypothetical protein
VSEFVSSDLPQFAPTSHLYRLDDGRYVLVIVPDGKLPLPPDFSAVVTGTSAIDPAPTEVFLCDEHAVLVDADGDPTNGLTALAAFPPGTTHEQALEAL